MSGSSSRRQAATTGANASLISTRSMSSIVIPLRSSSLRVAGIGPSSIFTGSQPTVVWSTIRARGVSPSCSAFSRDMSSTAAAPSEICDELPAVILPSGLNAGLSCESFSRLVSGRMPWSVTYVSPLTWNGTISRSKRPSSVAWCGEAVRAHGELVELGARDLPLVGDHLGAEALADDVVLLHAASA